MSQHAVGVLRGAGLVRPLAAPPRRAAKPGWNFATMAATVGAVVAGAAIVEAALIPGVVIGGAAMLAPKILPQLRRGLEPLRKGPAARPSAPAAAPAPRPTLKLRLPAPGKFAITQAVAKTITFRIIVTTLDFTTNYVVLGELSTAAGLSAFALMVGPVFYLVHEMAWNSLGPPAEHKPVLGGATVAPVVVLPDAKLPFGGRKGFRISRAVVKTITFRSFASTMDFTVNYVVVGDVATAIALSAVGFIAGPFVYLGHEMAWDHFGAPKKGKVEAAAPVTPLPAPLGRIRPRLAIAG